MVFATLSLTAAQIQAWVIGTYKVINFPGAPTNKTSIINITSKCTLNTGGFNNIKIYTYALIGATYYELGNVRPGFKRTFSSYNTAFLKTKIPFIIQGDMYFSIWQAPGVGTSTIDIYVEYDK
jgi:hypothetical protein